MSTYWAWSIFFRVLCVVICVLCVIGTILELLIGSNVISYEVKESISSNENNIHMKEIEKQDDTEYMEEAMVFSTEKRTNSFFFFCTNISIRKGVSMWIRLKILAIASLHLKTYYT